MLSAQFAHCLEELGGGGNQVHVADHGFDDHSGDFVAMLSESVGQFLRVIVGQDHRVLCQIGRDAAGRRVAKGQCAGAGLDQQAVGVAVIAAFKFDQRIAAGVAPGETDGAHRRFGAGRNQTNHLH